MIEEMGGSNYSIPIQQLTTEQLKTYHDRHCTLESGYFNIDLMAAIRHEIKEREIKEQMTAKTTKKPFRWDIVTYALVTVLAIICGLSLRTIVLSYKCPPQVLTEQKINVN